MGRASVRAAWAMVCLVAAAPRPAAAAELPERPGLALRSALVLRSEGRATDAVERLEAIERRWPLIGDHAARLAVEIRAQQGDPAATFAAATAFAARHPDSPAGVHVARLRGDAASALGRSAEARSAWRTALEGTDAPDARGELWLSLARAAEATGDLAAARSEYLSAWNAVPTSPVAAEAERALAALEAARKLPARDALDWSTRGEALAAAGLHSDAVAAYDRALGLGPPAALGSALYRGRAQALFSARRYPEAGDAFEALGGDAEARFWHARCTARSGDLLGAISAFESLAVDGSPYAARARMLAASLLADETATEERAAAHYADVAEHADDPALRRDAAWRLGWLRYRQGRNAEAAEAFAALRALESDPIAGLRARYFELRARERTAALVERFAASYGALAREAPLSYYGWRASLRAGAEPLARALPSTPLPVAALPAEPVARIEILIEAGLSAEADLELEALAPSARGDAERIALAELAYAAGNARRATALVGEGRAWELAQGPIPGREQLWRLAWPRAFEADVVAAASADGVPPELVWALMREESGFAPDALSAVGARGLLQLMPETAVRMARELGLAEPHVDALYDPALNVRFGTHLLGGLLREFSGRLPVAIGAYNAGSAAVARWVAEGGALAEDEWVEAIPYDETRAYVRRVLRSLHAYQVLY